MSEEIVNVAILRGGKLVGKASADVQARIEQASSQLSGRVDELASQIQQIRQNPAAPADSGPGGGVSLVDNGNGTATLRVSAV